MRNSEPSLPKVLAEIAEVAGREAALKVAAARGGTRVYIPRRARDKHWLPRLVGREAADRICRHFAPGPGTGDYIEIPIGPAGAIKNGPLADRMIAEGRPEREIARATGFTTRGIRMRKARAAGRAPAQRKSLVAMLVQAARQLLRRGRR